MAVRKKCRFNAFLWFVVISKYFDGWIDRELTSKNVFLYLYAVFVVRFSRYLVKIGNLFSFLGLFTHGNCEFSHLLAKTGYKYDIFQAFLFIFSKITSSMLWYWEEMTLTVHVNNDKSSKL